jgi:hypothetical protein
MATTIDTKGDLVVGTGADTFDKLAAGSNGDTLVADSSASTGLRYQGNYAAGKNKIINGNMRISQRGTSFAIAANTTYTLDRFVAAYSTALPTAWTVSQETFTPGTAPVAGYESANYLRSTLTTIGTATFVSIRQLVEDVRTFAGQTVTFSFWAKADADCTISLSSTQVFGSGGSGAVDALTTTSQAITTSWVRYSFTYAVPSISGKTIGTNSYINVRINHPNGQNSTIDTWGWQLEAGSVATAFETATGTIQGELAACQRYAYRISGSDGNAGANVIALGCNNTATSFRAPLRFPVKMRKIPSMTSSNSSGHFTITGNGNVSTNYSTVGLDFASLDSANLDVTTSGQTIGQALVLYTSNSSSSLLFDAEL